MQEEMARIWEKCDDYKSRCEKAVEYIKEHQDMVEWIHIPGWELLNILQNGSENDE